MSENTETCAEVALGLTFKWSILRQMEYLLYFVLTYRAEIKLKFLLLICIIVYLI